ncbi:MAG: sigma-54 dependent transcriptional regulator [Acidobacteriota bacterium]
MKNTRGKVLIVDDELAICSILSYMMLGEEIKPIVAYNGNMALQMIHSETPDVMLLDFRMPGIDGLEVLRIAKELDPALPIIMITAYGAISSAVKAIKAGAYSYLAKPFEHREVIELVHSALSERNYKRNLKPSTNQPQENNSLWQTMGRSSAIGRIITNIHRVAKSNFTALIQGETGSGKELVARAIHLASPRASASFVPVDCGAIPEALLESELFGYEKGAFTGADFKKQGKFELAESGTLFLDEISNMPLSSQAKLLRILQDKMIYRIGSTKPIKVDVRLVAASNEDLQSAVTSGSFRRDLFFRLNEFTIKIPPLRERKEDIIYLANRFLETTNVELCKNIRGFSEPAIETLLTYRWPGNVRQLRSTIRRAVLLADEMICEDHLDITEESPNLPTEIVTGITLLKAPEVCWDNCSLKEIVHQNTIALEREILRQALHKTGGNKAKAARLLHVDYKTIHSKVKEYGIITE